MDWITNLLLPGNTSIAATLVLYSFVIALGIYLGKLRFGGVSLGVTFVLFVGIVMGHFGYVVDSNTLKFVREFGLIIFIFAIGLQVGPGFFSSFKQGGVRLNVLAASAVALNVLIVVCLHYFSNVQDINALVGVMSGAVTNTPGLAAAQQGVSPEAANIMAQGYAAAYPLGVIGIIASMFIIKAIFRIKTEKEIKDIEQEQENSQLKPYFLSIRVTNELVGGRTIVAIHDVIQCNFVVSRLMGADGKVTIPTSKTVVHVGDLLKIVCSAQDADRFHAVLGPDEDVDWESTPTPVFSRRILVTRGNFNGVTLGSLRLHNGYQLNATRVNRAGVDLLASPNLSLQVGDRITVVGNIDDINRLAEKLGNSMKRLNEPNMVTLFVGIFLGIILGSLPIAFPGMSVPMKLGLAGGPLVVAILISRFGYKMHLVTYTSSSASLMLREVGICLFLASVGIGSGEHFAETVFSANGLIWVLYGFLITFFPLIIVGSIARWKYKINYCSLMGLISGSYTDPPALAYGNKTANNDAPAVAYSTVYPLTMFLRVITAQILILALA